MEKLLGRAIAVLLVAGVLACTCKQEKSREGRVQKALRVESMARDESAEQLLQKARADAPLKKAVYVETEEGEPSDYSAEEGPSGNMVLQALGVTVFAGMLFGMVSMVFMGILMAGEMLLLNKYMLAQYWNIPALLHGVFGFLVVAPSIGVFSAPVRKMLAIVVLLAGARRFMNDAQWQLGAASGLANIPFLMMLITVILDSGYGKEGSAKGRHELANKAAQRAKQSRVFWTSVIAVCWAAALPLMAYALSDEPTEDKELFAAYMINVCIAVVLGIMADPMSQLMGPQKRRRESGGAQKTVAVCLLALAGCVLLQNAGVVARMAAGAGAVVPALYGGAAVALVPAAARLLCIVPKNKALRGVLFWMCMAVSAGLLACGVYCMLNKKEDERLGKALAECVEEARAFIRKVMEGAASETVDTTTTEDVVQ